MPTPTPDPVDTIERFAEISALPDDAFTEEADVLRAVGLDVASWEAIEAGWMAQLRSGTLDVEEVVERFGKVYRATRSSLSNGSARAAVELAARGRHEVMEPAHVRG
jgi:hypothetical protein